MVDSSDFKFVRVDNQRMNELAYVSKCLGVSIEDALAITINSAYEKIYYVFEQIMPTTTLRRRIRVMRIWHDGWDSCTYRGVVLKNDCAHENIIVDEKDVDPDNIELTDGVEYIKHVEAYFHACEMLYYNRG